MAQNISYDLENASAFQILIALIVFLGIILNAIVGFTQNNIGMLVLSLIFGLMLIFSLVISRAEILSVGNWKTNTVSFTIGFLAWFLLNTGTTQSVFSVSQNVLYSTLSGQVPLYTDFVFTSYVIPITEEYVWMIAIPYLVFGIISSLAKFTKFEVGDSVKIGVTTVIASITFALFHVNNIELINFLIAALIFRTTMVLLVLNEQVNDVFKAVNLLPSFAYGSHIANNWTVYGFEKGINVLLNVDNSFLLLVSVIILSTITLILGSGLFFIVKDVYGRMNT